MRIVTIGTIAIMIIMRMNLRVMENEMEKKTEKIWESSRDYVGYIVTLPLGLRRFKVKINVIRGLWISGPSFMAQNI